MSPSSSNTSKRDIIRNLAKSFEEQTVSAVIVYQSALLVYNHTHTHTNTNTNTNTNANNHNDDDTTNLSTVFQTLIASLPKSLLQSILDDLHQAFLLLSSKAFPPKSNSNSNSNSNSTTPSQTILDLQSAVHALLIIYTLHPKACLLGNDINLYVALVEYYEIMIATYSSSSSSSSSPSQVQHVELDNVLQLLSTLFVEGLLSNHAMTSIYDTNENENENENDEEDIHPIESMLASIMETIQILQNYSDTCLGDVQQWQEQQQQKYHDASSSLTLLQSIQQLASTTSSNDHSSQIQYLMDMLRSCPTYESYQTAQTSITHDAMSMNTHTRTSHHHQRTKSTKSITDPILPFIRQVQSIYPKLGQGYIEIALACYNFDPSLLIATLSSPSSILHPRLRNLDTKLPRQTQKSQTYHAGIILPMDSNNTNTTNDQDLEGMEARQQQKEFLRHQMTLEEERTYKLNSFLEYNDDYDDQYDGIGNDGKVGTGGNQLNDTVWETNQEYYDSVKLYNESVKQDLAEQAYWKDMENSNRSNRKGQKGPRKGTTTGENKNKKEDGDGDGDGEDGEAGQEDNSKKKWGPDKGKGGRLIGPDGKYLPFPKKGNRKQTQKQNHSSDAGNSNSNDASRDNTNHQKGKGKGKKHPVNGKHPPNGGKGGTNTTTKGKGGTTSSSNTTDTKMSKIQKRRKNDNKAKIGNHNRKDRATRKTGGM